MADPPETPRRLFRKADRGKDEATPAILIGGMTMLIGAVVGVLVAVALLIYFFV